MKKFLLFLLFILIFKNCFSQDTFFSSYDTISSSTTSVPFDPSTIVSCGDGNFIGLAFRLSNLMVLYKIDGNGNLLWWKELGFFFLVSPSKATKLSDSTIVFMIYPFSSVYSMALLKVDFNGNILWTRDIFKPSLELFVSIAPTTDGGFMLAGQNSYSHFILMHFDANGAILSQHTYTSSSGLNIYVHDMISDGNNQFSYCGIASGTGITNNPFVFFRSDSAGNVYNYTEYYIPQGFGPGYASLRRLIVKSANGGHYCQFPVNDSLLVNKKFSLMYLDSLDQLVWSKYIETADSIMVPSCIAATADNGCIVIAANAVSLNVPVQYFPAALKFSDTGNLEWSKIPGDTTSTYWSRLSIRTLAPAPDNGWVASVAREGLFSICKVDSAFNGFCNYQLFTPGITDFTPQAFPFSITSAPSSISYYVLVPSVTPLPGYGWMDCFTTSIAENDRVNNLALFPNPADKQFQISGINFQKGDELIFSDITGKICFTKKNQSLTSDLRLPTSHLNNGIYFLEIKTKEDGERRRTMNKKVVVQH
jgi:type IX secretion system substrate protein